jgi:hypothetical protein
VPKNFIGEVPILGRIARKIHRALSPFPGSAPYWERRYVSGGNSGIGSYGKLAEFKARVVNDFVRENSITSIIEYGCGDGNQLRSADYPRYLGFDVSPAAVSKCQQIFAQDPTKQFRLISQYAGETAELTLSLDVIYHLVEDDVFDSYMCRLFDSATRFVMIYSSNELLEDEAKHVRHRRFTNWVENNRTRWTLLQHIPNEFPNLGPSYEGSYSDFYIYRRGDNRGIETGLPASRQP